jgi:hypothetical protein
LVPIIAVPPAGIDLQNNVTDQPVLTFNPWPRRAHKFQQADIVLLDNDSTDDTVSVASEYDDVTVLRTKLPFGVGVEDTEGQNLMRRYLIERFGRNRWSLCVDIDE